MPVIKVAPLVPSEECCNREKSREEREESPQGDDENQLYRTLRPMLLTMRIFGLYYLDEPTFKNTRFSKISFGYSIFTLAILWGNLGINFPAIIAMRSLDEVVVGGSLLIWFAYCCFQGTALFFMCYRQRGWGEFFEVYQHAEDGLWNPEGHIHLKKRVNVYVIACWAAIISNIGMVSYVVFMSDVFDSLYLFTFGNDTQQTMILKGFYMFLFIWLSAAWIIPVVLSVMMNDLLATNFRCFNGRLAEGTKRCPINLCSILGRIRDMHQHLINITNAADTLFSSIAAMAIVFNVTLVCCVLYGMIYNPFNVTGWVVTLTQAFWLVCCSLSIFVNTGTCAWLHEEVSSLFTSIVTICS